ncbi:hypothetical protein PRIPAC_96032 [Pristionchus pacificus]|uniref:Uncharacterized protein n=1 Tax=Pristionchus pacificus TaxID=54126 RepID=A0A2A6CUG9_PRIPA|nr:hypothetical protein PRIPAC_96032 [Pristionchus pacificus]|eukprot:PDM81799.1 hypothetical protein PRIPAC_33953 [Pristionchus pacificus]
MAQSLDHKNLDKCWKDYLVGWRDQGLSLEEMSLRCKAMGHTCSPSSIKRLLDLPLEIVKAQYSPRPSTIPPELYDDVRKTIIDLYQEDDEITMIRLLLKIEEKFKLQLSDYPIERIRKEAGFVSLNVRHGHSVKLVNRQPRVDWCRARINEDCSFRRHVFTDESMVQLDPNSRKVWVLSTARERRIKSTFKFPQKVLIWGGISWKGVTNLVIMSESCRVDAPEYCRILRDGYIKWESEKYGGKSLLVQDNARCHTAKITQDFLAREEIKVQYIRHIHTQMRRVIEVDGGPVRE